MMCSLCKQCFDTIAVYSGPTFRKKFESIKSECGIMKAKKFKASLMKVTSYINRILTILCRFFTKKKNHHILCKENFTLKLTFSQNMSFNKKKLLHK